MNAKRFEARVSALEARVGPYVSVDADLAQQLAPDAATAPDAAEVAAVADNLETTIAGAEPRQARALLRLLAKDLRVIADRKSSRPTTSARPRFAHWHVQ